MANKIKCRFCDNPVSHEGEVCEECIPLKNPQSFVICTNCGKKFPNTPVRKVHKNARLGGFCKQRGCIYVVEINSCKKCDPEEKIETIQITPHKVFFRKAKQEQN